MTRFRKASKPSRWAAFDKIEGAIGHKAKASVPKARKASEPEHNIQVRAEKLCDALGIRWFRIPDKLMAFLHNYAPDWVRIFVSKYLKGIPDLMLFKRLESGDNLCCFIEIKTEVGKVTQGQEHWHRGLNVHVTYGWAETEKAINDFANLPAWHSQH